MADLIRSQLEQARALIEEERIEDAIALLKSVTARQPNNADAWFMMGYATNDPEEAYAALTNALRADPNHEEAREAYQMLLEEFPNLGVTAQTGPELDDLSVDIDELLAKTGGLDQNQTVSPMMRPRPSEQDVSQFYLDQAWQQREDAPETAQARPGDLDLDDLFGDNAIANVPATPTEEQDLDAMFGVPTEQPAKPARSTGRLETPPPAPSRPAPEPAASVIDDDFFGTATPAATNDDADLFGREPFDDREVTPTPAEVRAAAAEMDRGSDLDSFFGPAAATDPFGSDKEPDFVGTMNEPQKGGHRRRRGEKQAEPVAEPFPTETDDVPPMEPEQTRRGRRAKPTVIRAEEEQPIPALEIEQRANRRSRVPLILLGLVAVAAIVAAVILLPRLLAPDPVDQAVATTRQQLVDSGFTEVNAAKSGNVVQVTVCGVPGPGLRNRVFEAMDLIAQQVATVRANVGSAQIAVVACGDPTVTLYRATAPIDAVIAYVDSGMNNKRQYRASWQTN